MLIYNISFRRRCIGFELEQVTYNGQVNLGVGRCSLDGERSRESTLDP